MGSLADLRADLVAAIGTAAAPAFDHLPERLHPPAKIVEPAEPYITDDADGLTFGQHQVAFDVFVLAPRGTNKRAVSELDELIEEVLAAVEDTAAWFVRSVGQPFVLEFGPSARYTAAIVRVTTDTTL